VINLVARKLLDFFPVSHTLVRVSFRFHTVVVLVPTQIFHLDRVTAEVPLQRGLWAKEPLLSRNSFLVFSGLSFPRTIGGQDLS
jgi:hypothetical protein